MKSTCLFDDESISRSPSAKVRLSFGMYKGLTLAETPRDYLEWLVEGWDGKRYAWLIQEIRRYLDSEAGGNGNGQSVAERILSEWWDEIEDEYGPDSEAPIEVWQALSYAHERLRQMAGIERRVRKPRRRS